MATPTPKSHEEINNKTTALFRTLGFQKANVFEPFKLFPQEDDVAGDDDVTGEITEITSRFQCTQTLWQNTGVSHGRTVLGFGSEPFERRFHSVACVLSKPEQAVVSSLGADVPPTPHYPQKTMPRNSHESWLSCTTPFPSTSRCTRCSCGDSISLCCLTVEAQFPRTTGVERSSSSLHLTATADGTSTDGASIHRSSCRATVAEHVVGSWFHVWSLAALRVCLVLVDQCTRR